MEESQFISLAAAAKMTNYSQDYISLLCRQGKLKAQKLGRNWVTTKEWVYEYIDKTEGKGASIVPVRIDNKSEKEKRSNGNEKKNGQAPRPLFGSFILEMAVFCAASIIVITNVFGFQRGIKEVDRSFELVKKYINFQNYIMSYRFSNQDKNESLSAADAADNEICSVGEDELQLLSFETQTDQSVIDSITAKMESSFNEPVTVEAYKDFAVISLKSDSQVKYLYMIEGAD